VVAPPFIEVTKLIYAEPKVGKTSFVNGAPDHFFIATEEGHDFVDPNRVRRINRWDPDPTGKDKRLDFKTLVRAIYEARKAGKLKHRSVTIDTIDNLSNWCLTAVCARYGVAYPGDRDGKLWKEMHTEWAAWIDTLLSVVTVNFITHSADDKIDMKSENGLTVEVKRRVPTFKGNKFAQAIDSRVNAIGFAYIGADGKRWIQFSPSMNLTTGSRIAHLDKLPPLPLDWAAVTAAYDKAAKEAGVKVRSKWT
jgi:hypothetical protein